MVIADLVAAFREASSQLRFEFEASFPVTLPDGSVVESIGRLPQFGSARGALLFAEQNRPSAASLAALKEMGYFASVLFESYGHFDERLFAETLDDWGFFGTEKDRPAWYTGRAW